MKLTLEKIEGLILNLKSYANSTIEIIKLETVQQISSIITNLMSRIIIGVVFMLFAFFLSIGVSFYLSELLGSNYLGFGIVAGVYLLLGIILVIGREKLLIRPFCDKFIQEIFQKQANKK